MGLISLPHTKLSQTVNFNAGKTTLMDVIAGRKTVGEITGDIWVNGKPKDQRSWSRVMGYVEQNGESPWIPRTKKAGVDETNCHGKNARCAGAGDCN